MFKRCASLTFDYLIILRPFDWQRWQRPQGDDDEDDDDDDEAGEII